MSRFLSAASLMYLFLAFACGEAWAHKPVVIDGGPTDAQTAHDVPDPGVSYVGYHEATPGAPALWFTFEARQGTPLYLQPGVPRIDRFGALRPAMALLGPGLPAVEVPFAVPEGYGGQIFVTDEQDPVVFEEEFTGTTSWQFPAVELAAPVTGRYYLVGYLPGGESGKFWMAIGEEEAFGLADLFTLPQTLVQVRLFHEIFPFGGLLGWALVFMLLAVSGFIFWFL